MTAVRPGLRDDEKAVRDRVRAFVGERVLPEIAGWYEAGTFPREVAPELGRLGVLGMHIHGHGCAGASAVQYGLACMELEAGDGGLRTLVSVQGSLAMSALDKWGSEEQKAQWLPPMAAGEALGCFGLTEPGAGSDPASMTTRARREPSGDWVLNGRKRWIGHGGVADVAIVWARAEDGVRGFVLPRGTPGFSTRDITGKLSMRASLHSELIFEDCRLPADAVLPEAQGLRGPFACLNEARYGIAWGSMGAARACFEIALARARDREQFGKPIGAFQLTQRKLVDMLVKLGEGSLLALHLGRMKDAGTLAPEHISLAKLANVRDAQTVARTARGVLGGDGILGENHIMRHMANLEAVATYEGTEEIHTLILGRALTGLNAFS
jgi:glutaryl-CoA dehydrogenase